MLSLSKTTSSALETEQFGAEFAQNLSAGQNVFLYGELGAGKTTFTRGLCAAFGYERAKSPSFALIHTYKAQLTIFHIDLYRIHELDYATAAEIFECLADESAIKIIEWSEKLGTAVNDFSRYEVRITKISPDERKISITFIASTDHE